MAVPLIDDIEELIVSFLTITKIQKSAIWVLEVSCPASYKVALDKKTYRLYGGNGEVFLLPTLFVI